MSSHLVNEINFANGKNDKSMATVYATLVYFNAQVSGQWFVCEYGGVEIIHH